jgi:hypothetical protein
MLVVASYCVGVLSYINLISCLLASYIIITTSYELRATSYELRATSNSSSS